MNVTDEAAGGADVIRRGDEVLRQDRDEGDQRPACWGFIGETLRQAGILITGSAVIVLGLVFILGLQCGIEGAYAAKSVGRDVVDGARSRPLCDLREVIPYAFGYMMAAKVGTGFVAEIGSMRISDEIDALEVMGFDSILYLGSTRLLGTWLVLPFLYMISVAVGFAASYLADVIQLGQVSKGRLPPAVSGSSSPRRTSSSPASNAWRWRPSSVLVCIYYGYHVTGGTGRRRQGKRHSRWLRTSSGSTWIGMIGTQLFWGGERARAPIGG